MQPQHSEYRTDPLPGKQAPRQGAWSMADAATTEVPVSPPAVSSMSTRGSSVSLRQAEDGDVIEREWVDAVKKAATDSGEDPYELARALIALKVEYMKKRYNQDIKIPE